MNFGLLKTGDTFKWTGKRSKCKKTIYMKVYTEDKNAIVIVGEYVGATGYFDIMDEGTQTKVSITEAPQISLSGT